jgi:cytochrome b pre-mRNA-processing protein 3
MDLSFLKKLLSRTEGRSALIPLYRAIIAEARQPVWYAQGKAPDTLDGRFDMVAAITTLVLLRFEHLGEAGKYPSVMLTEIFVDDMEGQLREDGVGDVTVGKHIGRMMAALGGRIAAYRAGLAEGGDLPAALIRNIWRGETPPADGLVLIESRIRATAAGLATCGLDDLIAGKLTA